MHHLIKRRQIQIRRRIYAMKQRFGVPGDLYKLSIVTPNYETGGKDAATTVKHIPKMIMINNPDHLMFKYDLGYLRANSNFTYGGHFEVGDGYVVIDGLDLGTTNVVVKDYIVYENKRWDIKDILELEGHAGYILHVRHTTGTLPSQQIKMTVAQQLSLEETNASA